MSKVCLVVKLVAQKGKGDEIVKAFEPMFEQAAKEPGTELYVLSRSSEDPDVLYLCEVYTDRAAFDAHTASDAMKAVLPIVSSHVVGRERLEGTIVRAHGLAN